MKPLLHTKAILLVLCAHLSGCNSPSPSSVSKLFDKTPKGNDALIGILDSTNVKLFNTQSIKQYYKVHQETIFMDGNKANKTAVALQNFINKDVKYFGLYSSMYHQEQLDQIATTVKMSEKEALQAELICTDAWFQVIKHLKNGRLYTDTSSKHLDTVLTQKSLIPALDSLVSSPERIYNIASQYEPKMHDYDSLKNYLKQAIDAPATLADNFTPVTYQQKDSVLLVKAVIARLQQEGIGSNLIGDPDSSALSTTIKSYQESHNLNVNGKVTAELVADLNKQSSFSFKKVAITLDKFKNLTIPNDGNYVLVNIPSYVLRGYNKTGAAIESKVAVGKLASKTPVMESEISDIIIMPKWFVPPSILKLPGYIARKRNNPNYIVRGNSVVQKSGPGNALGEMKFNFQSGNAIYLHDTNEKWAFNSAKRAVSHGCVRVQKYKELATFITRLTPLVEKTYTKVIDKIKIDSFKNDTIKTFKYVVKDSVIHKGDVVPNMVKHKSHMELEVQHKLPIYIKYMTCAVRNGKFIIYDDVYGYDKILAEKYFKGLN
jgi:L,D-transpeptidase YcbB